MKTIPLTLCKKYGFSAINKGNVPQFYGVALSLEEYFPKDSTLIKEQLKVFEQQTLKNFSTVYASMMRLDDYLRKVNTTSKLYQSKKAQLENLHTEFMGLLMISKIHSPKEESKEMKQIINDYMKRDWFLKRKLN